jgi:hypothetical protein
MHSFDDLRQVVRGVSAVWLAREHSIWVIRKDFPARRLAGLGRTVAPIAGALAGQLIALYRGGFPQGARRKATELDLGSGC